VNSPMAAPGRRFHYDVRPRMSGPRTATLPTQIVQAAAKSRLPGIYPFQRKRFMGSLDSKPPSPNDFELSTERFDLLQVATVILTEIVQPAHEIFRAGTLNASGRDAENLPQLFFFPLVAAIPSKLLTIAADQQL
jgi:hypothetical protein